MSHGIAILASALTSLVLGPVLAVIALVLLSGVYTRFMAALGH
jgi:hypothetical protein